MDKSGITLAVMRLVPPMLSRFLEQQNTTGVRRRCCERAWIMHWSFIDGV
jgi:hypothetical protein